MRQNKKLFLYLVFLIVIALIAWGLIAAYQAGKPQGEDFSREILIQSISHIPEGSAHEPYNSNPPTSGPHYVKTAKTGFREEIIPDENLVHNLEHGDVWISFKPNISEAVKNELKDLAALKVVVTPRPANEFDIALAAWGRLDTFNVLGESLTEAEETRISDFIKRYLNKGPEKVSGMNPNAI